PEMTFTVVYAQEGNRNSAGGYRYQGGKQVSETSFTESGWNFIMERLTPEREYNLQDNIIARLTYALTKGQFSHRRDFGILMNGFPSGLAADLDRSRTSGREMGTPGLKSAPFTKFAKKETDAENEAGGAKQPSEMNPATEAKKAVGPKQSAETEKKETDKNRSGKNLPASATKIQTTMTPDKAKEPQKEEDSKKSHGLMNRFLDTLLSAL
ncbi:MAG: hypothetical protein J5915_06255, partial [Acidaminococcaceae bacterium]|nr:hypothetical protein [Acidaminococcaceae bacterium]